jgi:hypothetical protein
MATMSPKFDLFMKLSDGHPIWIKAVEGLEEAKGELQQMAVAAPGDYFIFDTTNGRIISAGEGTCPASPDPMGETRLQETD